MPEFAYTARDVSGNLVNGLISAGSEREALSQLSQQDLFPLEVAPEQAPRMGFSLFGGVSGQTMAAFYAQLAGLLKSGVPMLRSLAVLRDQSTDPTLKATLANVHSRLEEGQTLSEAFEKHPAVFDEMGVSMVRAGGEGGFLEEALERIGMFTEEADDLRSRTMGALAYPVFLAVVGMSVVTALLIFVVPNFAKMFDRLRAKNELPYLTDALLGFSGFLNSWGGLALGLAILGAIVATYFYVRTEPGRRLWDMVKLKLPLAGGIFESFAVAGFCRVLGTMLRNGVPILKALEISRQASGNRIIEESIAQATDKITAGKSLAGPLRSSGRFPPDVVEMIAVAEESNTLDVVLINVADGLERRTTRQLDLMVRLLEPIMLLIMAGIVLMVVIALLLPVIKMSSTI